MKTMSGETFNIPVEQIDSIFLTFSLSVVQSIMMR